jgi:hypothetical protein
VTEFVLLTVPSANRVYGRHASRLALAELAVIAPSFHCQPRECRVRMIGGVEYVRLEMDELDDHDQFILSNLSGTYALFEVLDRDRGEALMPLPVERLAYFEPDLITIQRYVGKTNEQFTHLLVNLAVAVSSAARERTDLGLPIRLLDPMAGRGTTLNRGLMYGFDVAGIDVDGSDFEAYRTFLTTYLKDHRRSFKAEEANTRKGPLAGTKRFGLRIQGSQRVDVIKGNTLHTTDYFGARSFDVLVCDLPYGVQHGSSTSEGVLRTPGNLALSALAGWRQVLRGGAGLALAWNTRTLERAELEDALVQAGFDVIEVSESFDHRVDRSITRGVVVATT